MRALSLAAVAGLSIAACGGGGGSSGAAGGTSVPVAAVTAAVGAAAAPAAAAPVAVSVPVVPRTVDFAGYTWIVKDTGSNPFGPGPNMWSGDAATVFVDAQGFLHLKVWQEAGVWKCAEVYLRQTLGYGTYSFAVQGDVSNLDPNIVLGLFVYSDAPAANHREMDIELGRWGKAGAIANGSYTVQPSDTAGNAYAWTQPAGLTASMQGFQWSPNQVDFSSRPTGEPAFAAFSVAGSAIPASLDEVVHMNLWLFGGNPPANGQPAEVVIQSFSFTAG